MFAAAPAELEGLPGVIDQHLTRLDGGGNLGAQLERAEVVAKPDTIVILDLPCGRILRAQVHDRLAALQTQHVLLIAPL